MGPDEILYRCVIEQKNPLILAEAHSGAAGVHYAGKAIAQNILTIGLWWPTIHKDAREYCHSCDICHRTGKPSRRDEMPLVPQVTLQAFDKWAIYFVGPINPPAKKSGASYIITATDYLTRWAEAQPIKNCSAATAAKFIFDNILSIFGCPRVLMSDHGSHFLNKTIEVLTEEFQVYHQKSTAYHP